MLPHFTVSLKDLDLYSRLQGCNIAKSFCVDNLAKLSVNLLKHGM